jgi:hypothetical protein
VFVRVRLLMSMPVVSIQHLLAAQLTLITTLAIGGDLPILKTTEANLDLRCDHNDAPIAGQCKIDVSDTKWCVQGGATGSRQKHVIDTSWCS